MPIKLNKKLVLPDEYIALEFKGMNLEQVL